MGGGHYKKIVLINLFFIEGLKRFLKNDNNNNKMPLFLLFIRDAEVSQNEYWSEYMLTIYIFLG